MQLRIATYNIHKGIRGFGRSPCIHDLKHALHELDADLIFLQEVQGQHDLHAKSYPHWPEQGQHEYLAGNSHRCAYGMNAIYQHGHHGNALLSRHVISQYSNHDVSDHAYEQRGILHVVVTIAHQEVHCYVLHLGLFAASRKRQIRALIEHIQATVPPTTPMIIAGDFNDWHQRISQMLYQELEVVEVFDPDRKAQHLPTPFHLVPGLFRHSVSHGRTFPAAYPCLSLDRVYVRGFTIEAARVMTGAPWASLSDHVPIRVDLRLAMQPHA